MAWCYFWERPQSQNAGAISARLLEASFLIATWHDFIGNPLHININLHKTRKKWWVLGGISLKHKKAHSYLNWASLLRHIFGWGIWPIKLFTPWDRLMTHIISQLYKLGLTFLFSLHHELDSWPTIFPHFAEQAQSPNLAISLI